ncbi:MAG: hypothetical protein AB8A35_07095 [Prochlorococcus sp.]|nr:hypothetical protein [Prochlorococcaceae cyanobacterium ETNP18_MAG_14]
MAQASHKDELHPPKERLDNQFTLTLKALVALTVALLILLPMQPTWATIEYPTLDESSNENNMPEVNFDSAMFDDLPFHQRRQALREESWLKQRETLAPGIPAR